MQWDVRRRQRVHKWCVSSSSVWDRIDENAKVTFQGTSQGQLAMVMYEWSDSSYLGKFPADAFDDRVSPLAFVQASTYSKLGDA